MKNNTLIGSGLLISTLSLGFIPQLCGLIAFVISVILLFRKCDVIGLYLLASSVIFCVIGTIFGLNAMTNASWLAMLFSALLDGIIYMWASEN